MIDKSKRPSYSIFADLVAVALEGNELVLRLSKRNNPYLTFGELKRDFLGYHVVLHVTKTKKLDGQSILT
jgi:hypothetical protein